MQESQETVGRIASTFSNRQASTQESERSSTHSPRLLDQILIDRQQAVDTDKLNSYRLERVREQLRFHDAAGAILVDPLNIRYATGTRNMMAWTMHAPARYAFVATEGPVVAFELRGSRHLASGFALIDEVRDGVGWIYQLAGSRLEEKTTEWADEIAALVREFGHGKTRLMVDRCEPWTARKLESHGLQLLDANEALDAARQVKSTEELECIEGAMGVGDLAIATMRTELQPGLTENQLWAVMQEVNIAHNGEWIECRLLSSGERTNPWFQECGNRVIQAGDMVTFDTDMVGPLGYLVDVSRAFVCPGKRATAEQRKLYEIAQTEVQNNLELLRPGVTFRELSEKAWRPPDEYLEGRYPCIAHGTGFVDEYPFIAPSADWETDGYDGVLVENMVVSIESYIGERGAKEGVKLEQQAVITSSGARVLSASPFLDALEL